MSSVTVQQVALAFGVDAREFEKGLKNVESAARNTKAQVLKYIAPLTAAFAGGKLFGNFLQSDQIGKFAASIGENVSEIDAWGEAVKGAGGTAEGFQATVGTLSKSLAEVATLGTGRAKEGLKALGISATDAQGKTRKATDVLLELAEKAEGLDKAQFLGLAKRLGLDEGTIRLLQEGNKSVKEQLAILRERAITEDDAQIAAEFNDGLQSLLKSFQALANYVFRAATPIVTAFSRGLTSIFDTIRKNKPLLIAALSLLAGFVGVKLVAALKAATTGVNAFTVALLKNPLGIIIFLIVGLLLLLDDIYVWFKGGESMIGKWFGPFEKAIEKAKKWVQDLKKEWQGLFDFIEKVGEKWDATVNFVGGLLGDDDPANSKKVMGWDTIPGSYVGFEPVPGYSASVAAASVSGRDLAAGDTNNTTTIDAAFTTTIAVANGDPAAIAAGFESAVGTKFNKLAAQAGSSTRN